MTSEEFLKAGQLEDALRKVQESVRKNPADAAFRVYLFQLSAVMGLWSKADSQLAVLSEMDADSMLLSQIYRPVLQAELVRGDVFRGKRAPHIFGEPEEWIGWLVHANQLASDGHLAAAAKLRDRAFDAAPPSSGAIDGNSFEWIADADVRFGPVLELILNGSYLWAPFSRIRSIVIEPPADLRNFVWLPVKITWSNGGDASAFIPVRYPGTESLEDGSLRLSRKTDWLEKGHGYAFGLGQRMLATDAGEYALLDLRSLVLNNVTPEVTRSTTEV
jgi:type VI secretion system protein ImpE